MFRLCGRGSFVASRIRGLGRVGRDVAPLVACATRCLQCPSYPSPTAKPAAAITHGCRRAKSSASVSIRWPSASLRYALSRSPRSAACSAKRACCSSPSMRDCSATRRSVCRRGADLISELRRPLTELLLHNPAAAFSHVCPPVRIRYPGPDRPSPQPPTRCYPPIAHSSPTPRLGVAPVRVRPTPRFGSQTGVTLNPALTETRCKGRDSRGWPPPTVVKGGHHQVWRGEGEGYDGRYARRRSTALVAHDRQPASCAEPNTRMLGHRPAILGSQSAHGARSCAQEFGLGPRVDVVRSVEATC